MNKFAKTKTREREMKTLVTFFSAQGTTKKVAQKIAKVLNADLFEIEPKQKYTDADLNWMDRSSRSSVEMNNRSLRPAIASKITNLNNYDTVLIGFPVWWYTAPTIVNAFIEENDLSGKKLYVFVTSGSSGVNGSFDDLKKAYPNLNFISGKRLHGNESEAEIKSWVK